MMFVNTEIVKCPRSGCPQLVLFSFNVKSAIEIQQLHILNGRAFSAVLANTANYLWVLKQGNELEYAV